MTVRVTILLGGMLGPDGWIDSDGMLFLRDDLRKIDGVIVETLTWNEWTAALNNIADDDKTAIIGYSGGGSRATWLANSIHHPTIDLMVLYDPSPSWQMQRIGSNVKRAICYHNTKPDMFVPFIGSLGGGVLVGTNVETIDIAIPHLKVQFSQSLHQRTTLAVKALIEAQS